MIKAESLIRKYGNLTAVDNVSFEIPRGQIVGLLGHNGAGKTTIMKMLTGYLEPNSGRVLIDETDITQNRLSAQKKIGYLPENCPVYPEMTVIDYLEYVAELRGIPADQRRLAVREAIKKTELGAKASADISTLSKGYRQRVGIAQAIVHNPEILIMDEPTSGLDPSQIQEIRGLIRALSVHSTIMLSTHILQEVEAVCDRVIIILQGRLALDARLTDLKNSNRVFLGVDRGPEDVSRALKKVDGIKNVNLVGRGQQGNNYSIELSKSDAGLSSQIAKAVIHEGFSLFWLRPEQRDLESVFREISSGGEKHAQ